MNINIFWHICQLNNWQEIIEDQYNTLCQSKILDIVDNVFISFIGKDINSIDFLLSKNSKLSIKIFGSDYTQYERQCLHSLLEWSNDNNSYVMYMHGKGVSYPGNTNVWNWRKMLEHITINNHTKCIEKLSEFDVVGSNVCSVGSDETINGESHRLHFSGNFWWSKTEHIKTLPKIRNDLHDLRVRNRYWLCERWILCNYPNVKYHEIYRSPLTHYYKFEPPNISTIHL